MRFVTAHSKVAESSLRRMMSRTDQMANDIGSIVDGAEAVRCGMIDRIGGLSDALACLRELAAKKREENGEKGLAKSGASVVE